MKRLSEWLGQFDWGAFIGTALFMLFYCAALSPVIVNAPILFSHNYHQKSQPGEYGQESASVTPAAQRDDEALATYTFWLVVFTAFLAASTIGLWWVTAKTLSHAKDDAARQANDSRRQHLHMMESNVTARRASIASSKSANAAMLAAQASIAAETAHIKVVGVALKSFGLGFFGSAIPTPITPLDIFKSGHPEIEFRNSGRTEGDLISISINYFTGYTLPEVPVYAEPEKVAPFKTIAANGGTHRWSDYKRPKPTDQEIELAGTIFGGGYWIYGYIVFLDYMNQRQRVRFCYKLGTAGLAGGIGDFFYPYGPDAYFGQEPEPNKP